jgi:K+-sensing histidine kinase KdpD
MSYVPPDRLLRAVLYGGGATLLLLDLFFLGQAAATRNYVPLVPVLAGILTAGGLLFILYAEQRAREDDRKAHWRIAKVSHQLTAPLQLLQEDLASLKDNSANLPSTQRFQIKQMATKSKVVLENIRDVFLTLQAQEGTISQATQAQDVCPLVDHVYRQLTPLASAHNIKIQLKPLCPQAVVRVDKKLFLIAITHVMENAIYYSRTPGQVTVHIVRGQKDVRVVVQDRGIGIASQDESAVFRPWARGRHADQYDPDGIGIGLALTRLILKEFNGSIHWTKKSPGLGTIFTIHLPLKPTR